MLGGAGTRAGKGVFFPGAGRGKLRLSGSGSHPTPNFAAAGESGASPGCAARGGRTGRLA